MLVALSTAVWLWSAQLPASVREVDDQKWAEKSTANTARTNDDGRGSGGTVPAWRSMSASLARARLGMGGVGLAGVQAISSDFLAGGLGISAEAGVIFGDRLSLLWRGQLVSSVGSILGTNGVFVELAFGEHFAAGLGTALTIWQTLIYLDGSVRTFQGFTFPLSAQWTFAERPQGISRREGVTLSAHFAPGFNMLDATCPGCFSSESAFGFTTGLGIGYLWW